MSASRVLLGLRRLGPMLVLATLPAAPSQAQTAAAELVGYDVVATGMAVTAYPAVPALLPFEAPAEATVSLATATLSSGGQGFGRASTFFPGTPITGIRPLVEIASGQRLPLPDYPIVVESREFEPAKHNEQPGITMSSDVDGDRAVVVADAGGTSIPGVLTVRSARTVSTSLLEGTTVTATSTSTLEQVVVGDVLTIDEVVSTSTVTSDATTASCEGAVTVSGVHVSGQPATIDETGIHLEAVGASAPAPLGEAGASAGEAAAPTGLTARLLGGTDACEGALGSRATTALLVSVPLPAAAAVPPGGHVDLVLASTSATAGASTLPPFELPAFDPPAPLASHVVTRLPGPASGGTALTPASPVRATPPTPSSAQSAFTTQPVAYSFGGIPATLLLGLGCAVPPVARRVRRYVDRVVTLLDPT